MASHVLLVDDSTTVRIIISAELREAGFRVTPVPTLDSARRALNQYRSREPFDLAILDVQLPDGDGIDLLREIRRDPAFLHLPVMILSSDVRFGSRLRGLGVGADDFVGKPHSKAYLVSRARALTGTFTHTSVPDKSRRVLIVDSNAGLREELGNLLRIGHGCDVVALENVDQTAQYLEVEGSTIDGAIVDRRCFLRVLGLLRSSQRQRVPIVVLDDSRSTTSAPPAMPGRMTAIASALVMPRSSEVGMIADAILSRFVETEHASPASTGKIPIGTINAVPRLAKGA